jgi:2-polyprenyl-3-methyl-5-hydroxy-6-metoxy-1,4-benzoquinol methylase
MLQKSSAYYFGERTEMLPYIPLSCQKILEVGCGDGNFLRSFVEKGTEVWGIEPVEKAAKAAKTKLFKVFIGTLEAFLTDLPDNYFDAIIFNDVLEHMVYPDKNLIALKNKLTSEGVIVTSIPNFRYIKNLNHVVLQKDWRYTQSGILDDTHFRFFTKKSMIALFEENGYQVKTIEGINPTKSIKYQVAASLMSLFTFSNHFDTLYMQFAIVATRE